MKATNTIAYFGSELIVAIKGFMIEASGLTLKYSNVVKATESNKHTSLVQCGKNCDCKKVLR
jgi:hypothetical protein